MCWTVFHSCILVHRMRAISNTASYKKQGLVQYSVRIVYNTVLYTGWGLHQYTEINRGDDCLQHRTTQVEEGQHHSHLHRNVNCVYHGELHSMHEDCFQQVQYTRVRNVSSIVNYIVIRSMSKIGINTGLKTSPTKWTPQREITFSNTWN